MNPEQAPKYLLHDKVWRADMLEHAYRLCRENGGAAGVDGETFEAVESREGGLEGWLGKLPEELREERYRPQAVRRVMIPKPDGGERRTCTATGPSEGRWTR
ncbi:MAG: hypothetical protein K6T30_08985 [Alicyclobacillus sp.]|nr:hypothetical protein [Alicyclobacillus sp.]